MTYSPHEMMTIAAARSLSNNDICFVGIGFRRRHVTWLGLLTRRKLN